MRRPQRAILTAALTVALLGCSSGSDDNGDGEADAGPPIPSVTVPAERLTPFCEAMIELTDRLETDPPDDSGEVILETYLEIVDEVPAEIESEFMAVIAALQGDVPATTPDDAASTTLAEGAENLDAEGHLPGDSPSERVSDYVLFACRDSDNNPGPPATQPLGDVVLDDTSP